VAALAAREHGERAANVTAMRIEAGSMPGAAESDSLLLQWSLRL